MPTLKLLSVAEQISTHLRADLLRGRWRGTMPGADRLAVELGVNRNTMDVALRLLEREGLLTRQGPGRKRLIRPPAGKTTQPMRIGVLLYEKEDFQLEFLNKLPDALTNAGHTVVTTAKSLMELKMDVERVRRLVNKTSAEAWVVAAGSREVLEWFSSQPLPVFALFGRRQGLPIASIGPDFGVANAVAVRHLARLSHRRIVMLNHWERRVPNPGPPERVFLDELKALGIPVGDYNLPDWEETKPGLRKLLNSLFRVTPPTAMIIDGPTLFIATQQFLAEQGLRVPQQVSLVNMESEPYFNLCMTEVSHYRWDKSRVVPRIIRWAAAVSRGRRDVKQTVVPAEFITGGTIGPAPAQ